MSRGDFCPGCGRSAHEGQALDEVGPFARNEAALRRAAETVDAGVAQPTNAPPPMPPRDRAASPPTDATASLRAPAADASPLRRGPRPAMIIGAVGLALVAAAIAVALVLLSRGSDTSASYRQKVAATFAPVVNANRTLSDALASLHGTDASSAKRAAAGAQSATVSAQGALGALTVPSDSQQLASQARQALDREQTYVTAAGSSLADPASPAVSQVQGLAGNLTSALDAVGGPLTGASQSVSGADTLTSWAQHNAHNAAAHQQTANSGSAGGGQQASSSGGGQQAPSSPYANGRDCGGGLFAGPSTSCDFAANVRSAYYNAPGLTATVTVYSPVTGQTYAMDCSPAGTGVTCSGGNGASVAW